MRRSYTRSIGDVLGEFVRDYHYSHKLKEVEVVESWNELLGPAMRNYAGKAWFSGGVLYVEITSSVVRAELSMRRDDLRTRINEKMGEGVVKRIVLR